MPKQKTIPELKAENSLHPGNRTQPPGLENTSRL